MDDIRDDDGNVWRLGWKAPSEEVGKLRAGTTSLQDWRTAQGLPPLIPRSEWTAIDFVTGYPSALIEDQRSYGACTAATITGAGNRQRLMRGQKYVPLSWCWLYDQVNGGEDSGSNIYQASEVARRLGVPPMALYPDCRFRKGQNPAGEYYGEDIEVRVDTFDELGTALLMGILPQFPVDAANCQKFDGDGIGKGKGRSPNHSVYAAGLKNISGEWVVRGVNSWRPAWGPFKNGTWLMTEKQIKDCDIYRDGIGHISTLDPVTRSGEAQ